jgi:hypothetical protein
LLLANGFQKEGGDRPFRSSLPFAAWQNTPSGAGLTLRRRFGRATKSVAGEERR